jgi:arylsulfatase A-like enzyme
VSQPNPSSPDPVQAIRQLLQFAVTAGLSVGLSVGCLDLSLSILRQSPPAFAAFPTVLPPLAASVLALFLGTAGLLAICAFLTRRAVSLHPGAALVSLATGTASALILGSFYNALVPDPTPTQSQLLFLILCLSGILGVHEYDLAKSAWGGAEVPLGIRIVLLAAPLLSSAGFLASWAWTYGATARLGHSSVVWALGVAVFGVVVAGASARLAQPARALGILGSIFVLLLIAGIAALPAALGSSKPARRATAPEHSLHKIILLSIDTLRADSVSTLSPAASPTQHLDSLAADSVVFTRAYSPAPWTLPAFVSIMTGVGPGVHGVKGWNHRIPDTLPLLAERLRDAGYLTAAIGHNPWLQTNRMPSGFTTYEMCPRAKRGSSFGSRIVAHFFPSSLKSTLLTPELTSLATRWLDAHAKDDFFLWVHFFKPHGPYEPKDPYRPRESPPPGIGYRFEGAARIRDGSLVLSLAQREWVRKLYEGEVRFVDDQVGVLLGELKRLGIYDEALIVFVSDHGEEFWEHGSFEHGQAFYDELLRVPLFVKLPGQRLRERRGELVCTGSIYPTLLDLAGVPHPLEELSYAPLSPLLGGAGGLYREVPILSATPCYYEDRVSIVFGDTKYILSLVTNREQLYDLKSDPGEQHDLAGAPSELLSRARAEMESATRSSAVLREHYGIQAVPTSPPSPETLEQLRSLGYVH